MAPTLHEDWGSTAATLPRYRGMMAANQGSTQAVASASDSWVILIRAWLMASTAQRLRLECRESAIALIRRKSVNLAAARRGKTQITRSIVGRIRYLACTSSSRRIRCSSLLAIRSRFWPKTNLIFFFFKVVSTILQLYVDPKLFLFFVGGIVSAGALQRGAEAGVAQLRERRQWVGWVPV